MNKLWGIEEKEEKEKKDYSHFFIAQDEKGNTIPHPDRHTVAPEGATTKLTKLESAKINHESMVEGKNNVIDVEAKKSKN